MTRSFAAFKPESASDQCALELAEAQIKALGWSFVWLTPESGASPLWFHGMLKSEGVTDLIAINRFRGSLEGHLPPHIRCHTLVTSLPPEWLGPSQHTQPHDRVSLMNPYALAEAASLFNALPATWPTASWSAPFPLKDIPIICIADHPSRTFAEALGAHKSLGPMMLRVLRALEESPAYLSRDQLDLLMALSERATGIQILNSTHRERLLSLIQAHVLAPQNARKTLVDLVRHNPGLPLTLVGHGWDVEPELAAYAQPTPRPAGLAALLARSRILLAPHAIETMLPGPDLAAAASARVCPLIAHPESTPLPPNLWGMPQAHDLGTLSDRLAELLSQPSATAKVALDFSLAWDVGIKELVWNPSETSEGPIRKAT
ncbi:MAG: hypothetical protein AB7F75_07700 [Planctomycetota bacterium]